MPAPFATGVVHDQARRIAALGHECHLVGAVVPTRRLGWTRLSAVDPAFGLAAAAATPASDRGFPRAVLVTADEVTLVPEGGDPSRLVVDDAGREGRRHRGDRPR